MSNILSFEEFVNQIYYKRFLSETLRAQELAGLKESKLLGRYAVEISFKHDSKMSLFEHKVYITFKKTNNRYLYHPENPRIPVKAHYHIYPPNSKNELYAVNTDGTAHHKANRGIQIPSKEADELRSLGVQIPENNIIESIEVLEMEEQELLLESLKEDTTYSIFLIVESD